MTSVLDLNMIFLKIRPAGQRGIYFELVDYRQPQKTTVGFTVDEEFDNPEFEWSMDSIAELQVIMQAALTLAVKQKAELN